MSKVSFEGIGEMVATFYAGTGVAAGKVVKMGSTEATVAACDAGDRFLGVAVNVAGGYAGVQMKGFTKVACNDSNVTVGYVNLAADANGGVKKVSEGGEEHLVVARDTAANTAVIIL